MQIQFTTKQIQHKYTRICPQKTVRANFANKRLAGEEKLDTKAHVLCLHAEWYPTPDLLHKYNSQLHKNNFQLHKYNSRLHKYNTNTQIQILQTKEWQRHAFSVSMPSDILPLIYCTNTICNFTNTIRNYTNTIQTHKYKFCTQKSGGWHKGTRSLS